MSRFSKMIKVKFTGEITLPIDADAVDEHSVDMDTVYQEVYAALQDGDGEINIESTDVEVLQDGF